MGTDNFPTEDTTEIPWKVGAKYGVVAYIIGWISTAVVILTEGTYSGEFPLWLDAGWIYNSAHFASMVASTSSESMTYNAIAEASLRHPTLLYQVIPMIVIVSAGSKLVSDVTGTEIPVKDAAKTGATLAIGYFLFATLSVVLFRHSEGSTTWAPDPISTLVFVGMVYPVLFGIIGAIRAKYFPEKWKVWGI